MKNRLINKTNLRWVVTGAVIMSTGYAYAFITGFLGLQVAWADYAMNGGTFLNEVWLNVISVTVLLTLSVALIIYFYKAGFSRNFKNWVCLIVGCILMTIVFSFLIVPILTATVATFRFWHEFFGLFSMQNILMWLSLTMLWATICYFIAWIVYRVRKN